MRLQPDRVSRRWQHSRRIAVRKAQIKRDLLKPVPGHRSIPEFGPGERIRRVVLDKDVGRDGDGAQEEVVRVWLLCRVVVELDLETEAAERVSSDLDNLADLA